MAPVGLDVHLTDLFRDEAVNQRVAELGVPLRITSAWMSVYAILLAIAIVALIAVIILGSYSSRETVTGFLVPSGGLIRIISPEDGRVVEQSVSEGQRVEVDEILFIVNVGAEASTGETVELVRASLLEQQGLIEQEIVRLEAVHEAESDQLSAEIDFLERQVELMNEEIKHRRSSLRLAEESLSRQNALLQDEVISTARVQLAELDVVIANLDLLAHQRSLTDTQGQLAESLARERGLDDEQENSISQLHRELAEIGRQMIELAERQTILIRSPVAGTVTRVTVSVGSTVLNDSDETPMLVLVPDEARLEAHLFAPSSAVGFVREGEEILLRYDAFAHQKFGLHKAYVSTISQTSVSANELPYSIESGEPLYVITAELENQLVWANGVPYQLQAGAKFHADLILEERKLWEWIVGPLAGAHSRM